MENPQNGGRGETKLQIGTPGSKAPSGKRDHPDHEVAKMPADMADKVDARRKNLL